MSSLLIMACHDTAENGRSEYTTRTLECLFQTVDWSKHRLIVVDNNSCEQTKEFLSSGSWYELITNSENVGTARAINQGLKLRNPGETAIKIDNDVVINQIGWVEEMEQAITRDLSIGIIGLKRKDLAESPNSDISFYVSQLEMLPHQPGERWIIVELVHHVMGTCQMLSPALLERAGYYYQKSLYGLDDSDMSYRSKLLGFKNCFLSHIDIDHIDTGGDNYSQWKQNEAGKVMHDYGIMCQEYRDGIRSLYYDGGYQNA